MKERKHKIDVLGTIRAAFRGFLKLLGRLIHWYS